MMRRRRRKDELVRLSGTTRPRRLLVRGVPAHRRGGACLHRTTTATTSDRRCRGSTTPLKSCCGLLLLLLHPTPGRAAFVSTKKPCTLVDRWDTSTSSAARLSRSSRTTTTTTTTAATSHRSSMVRLQRNHQHNSLFNAAQSRSHNFFAPHHHLSQSTKHHPPFSHVSNEVPSSSRQQQQQGHRRPWFSSRLFVRAPSLQQRGRFDDDVYDGLYESSEDDVDDPDEEDATLGSWLRWMSGGKPRGTQQVKLREAPELGGVPRSDRYSSRDWWHNTITLPNSAILRDIRSPVLACTLWAIFWSIVHQALLRFRPTLAHHLYIPGTPHSLTMSALGLLLVFRTNSAYQRFVEGREVWERIINLSRDLYRYVRLYEPQITIDKRKRMQHLLAAFPYLLRHRVRPNLITMRRLDDDSSPPRDPQHTILLYQDYGVSDLDFEAAAVAQTEETTGQSRRKTRPMYWVDKRTLPWRLLAGAGGGDFSSSTGSGSSSGSGSGTSSSSSSSSSSGSNSASSSSHYATSGSSALEQCARAQNRPLWVCDRMAQEIRNVPDSEHFTARERLSIVSQIDKLSHCIGSAERIHQTVVPLNYARHTLRALTLWLFSWPFALLQELQLLTGPVLFLVSWLLFGVYEIGNRIEDPWEILRLSILCDTVRRDVLADESIRSTAFQVETSSSINAFSTAAVPPTSAADDVASSSSESDSAAPDLQRSDGEDDELTELDLMESSSTGGINDTSVDGASTTLDWKNGESQTSLVSVGAEDAANAKPPLNGE